MRIRIQCRCSILFIDILYILFNIRRRSKTLPGSRSSSFNSVAYLGWHVSRIGSGRIVRQDECGSCNGAKFSTDPLSTLKWFALSFHILYWYSRQHCNAIAILYICFSLNVTDALPDLFYSIFPRTNRFAKWKRILVPILFIQTNLDQIFGTISLKFLITLGNNTQ